MSDLADLARQYADDATKPPAPAETPAAPEPTAPNTTTAPASTEGVPPQTTTAERWIEKIKFDGAEEEFDFDAARKDPEKRRLIREYLEKGRSFDTVVERRRVAGQREAFEWARKHGRDIPDNPFDVEAWKARQTQQAMSAAGVPPGSQAKDPRALIKVAREDGSPAAVALADLIEMQLESEEKKRAEEKQAREETERQEHAKAWGRHIRSEIEKRVKSFEGPESEALKLDVFRAAWGEITSNPNATGESVASLIAGYANRLDGLKNDVAKRFTTTKPAPSAPPVLNGAAPTSGTTAPEFDGDPSDLKGLTAYLKSRGHE